MISLITYAGLCSDIVMRNASWLIYDITYLKVKEWPKKVPALEFDIVSKERCLC